MLDHTTEAVKIKIVCVQPGLCICCFRGYEIMYINSIEQTIASETDYFVLKLCRFYLFLKMSISRLFSIIYKQSFAIVTEFHQLIYWAVSCIR